MYRFQNEGVGDKGDPYPKWNMISNNFDISDSVWCLSVYMYKVFGDRFIFWAQGDFPFSLSGHEGREKELRVEEHNIRSKEPIVYKQHLIPTLVLLCSLISRNQVSRTKRNTFLELNRPYKWINWFIFQEDNVLNKVSICSLIIW